MLLFRGEEHIDVWRQQWKQPGGATLTLTLNNLIDDSINMPYRRSPDLRRWTPAEGQTFFERLGLSGAFWKLGA